MALPNTNTAGSNSKADTTTSTSTGRTCDPSSSLPASHPGQGDSKYGNRETGDDEDEGEMGFSDQIVYHMNVGSEKPVLVEEIWYGAGSKEGRGKKESRGQGEGQSGGEERKS